jgi:hypothetical protein
MNTTNNVITNNKDEKSNEIVPEHLTDKEKANLMVAWAEPNKSTRKRNNNITKREGRVENKMKENKEVNNKSYNRCFNRQSS